MLMLVGGNIIAPVRRRRSPCGRKQLFQRLPECTPDHQDRVMHAMILEIASGKVITEADWFLHDRRRYLWPLAPGKFLLRKLNFRGRSPAFKIAL